jgi:16S rRNA (cytidine1402-2'-O)-methyltransferase
MPGTLYVVATPIGNLSDLTERARRVLAEVDHIAAEDTRHSRILLDHIGVQKRTHSLPAFDEKERVGGLVRLLEEGASMALVTDAGTPAISDPGGALVALAVARGVTVVPIPGACAAVAAVSVSGLPADRFCFLGFLPRSGPPRARLLQQMKELSVAVVLYESPHRLKDTLLDLEQAWGPRPALVARELTKLHEELLRGTLGEIAARLPLEVKGEVVLVVQGAPEPDVRAELGPEAIDAELQRQLQDGTRSIKDVAKALATQLGLPRKELYARALQLSGKTDKSE